jgi:hypothetical protein
MVCVLIVDLAGCLLSDRQKLCGRIGPGCCVPEQRRGKGVGGVGGRELGPLVPPSNVTREHITPS